MRRALAHPASALATYLVALVILSSCIATPPKPRSVAAPERIAAFADRWPGLNGSVEVSWDAHMIPSIRAERDEDVPYALGLVHAHLRLTQMELLKRASRGRLAESAGPAAASIDEAIRAFDLDRAVAGIEASLPPDTRAWIERYVAGVNDWRAALTSTPADFRALGFSLAEPWTVQDVLAVGRLASVDVNWGRFLSLIPLRNERGYDDFAQRLRQFADAGRPSFGPEMPSELSTLIQVGKSGSNAFVIAGPRSATGGALLASDPHLGLMQPNLWCVVAYRSPAGAAAGLSFPGLPFVLVGRNDAIGWTGTNMQASSSAIYRLADGWTPTETRAEPIGVRWWFSRTARIRESAFGPVVSDASLLKRLGDGDYALRWRGHEPSDEASAFLRASQATNWEDFRRAFSTYATGGQNILYADREGNIGQLLAIEAIPAAARAGSASPVPTDAPDYAWGPGVPSDRLPFAFNPPQGFLVSANNVPTRLSPALTPQGNANDRILRLIDLLSGDQPVTLDRLRAVQRDVYSAASHNAALVIIAAARQAGLDPSPSPVLGAIEAWDGHYTADSRGAPAYQRLLDSLIDELYRDRYADGIRAALRSAAYVHDFIAEDVATPSGREALRRALARAESGFDPTLAWGDLHRLRIAHPIASVPLLGRSYVFGDEPTAGTTTTIHKSAHAVQRARHFATYGANARLVCDLSTLDENYVVLLGGQDGHLGSRHLLDQIPMWQSGEMIRLPLSPEAQRAAAAWSVTLHPTMPSTPSTNPGEPTRDGN